MRKLLDGGAGTVEDRDEVVCVCVCVCVCVRACVRVCVCACLHPCASLPFLVCLVIGQCIHSSEGLVVFAPMVGGADSTVVGFLRWSPGSGERVGVRVQGESVSEGQGTSYSISCTCDNAHIWS